MEMNSNTALVKEAKINGRRIWLHEISTPIVDFEAVEYEQQGLEIVTKLFEMSGKADRYYNNVCKKILEGKI